MEPILGPNSRHEPDIRAEISERKGYWRPEPLGELLRSWARSYSSHTALVDGDLRLSYAQLDEKADRLASGLHSLGIAPGDRVLLQLPNGASFVAACFALFRLGAIPILVMPAQRASDIEALCEIAEPVAYIVPERFLGFDYRAMAEEIAGHHPMLRHIVIDGAAGKHHALSELERHSGLPLAIEGPDHRSTAVLLLSGGTTGTPKLIPRTHADYAYNARASAELCGMGRHSIYLAALPAAHNFPLCCPGILGTFSAGGTVVMARTPGCDEAFPLIERERVTVTALVPALAQLWIEAREWDKTDLSSLELLQVGGARLEPALAGKVQPALGCRLQQVFGMAEGLLCYTRLDDPDEVVFNTQGRPLCPDDEIRIVDANGHDVAAGECGELLVRGPYTIRGYYRAEEHNAVAFTPDGYYRSGDLVRLTAEGNLVVEGRVKNQINRGGEKIATAEIEQHLRAHPAVQDATVVAVPDERLGERSCAFLIAAPAQTPPDLAALHDFLRGRGLPRHKLPDQLEFARSWPLTAIGKIDTRQLARQAQSKSSSAGETAARSSVHSPTPSPTATHSYAERHLDIISDPLVLASAIAGSGLSDCFMVYEHAGEWSIGIGSAATVDADGTRVVLRHGENIRRWEGAEGTRTCAAVAEALEALPFKGWRAYGSANFELARQTHGLPLPDKDEQLLHLFVPEIEIRVRRKSCLLRSLDGEELPRLARLIETLDAQCAKKESKVESANPGRNLHDFPSTGRAIAVPEIETADADGYVIRVARALQEIRERRYQKVILSRKVPLSLKQGQELDVAASYLAGRRANNPARSFILQRGDFAAAGYSPETVVEVSPDGWVSTQPLAGTRALADSPEKNAALRAELLSDTKEIAEHAASVKLACEELERICAPDSVQVSDFMSVCLRGSVQHLGSRAKGRLRDGQNAWDAFESLFPAVTASGIPKREAIDAIGRHEPCKRGLYSGCVMIADSDGALDATLVLRSFYRHAGQSWLHAGAGLVVLSTPDREFRETCEKLQSVSPHLIAVPETSGGDGSSARDLRAIAAGKVCT